MLATPLHAGVATFVFCARQDVGLAKLIMDKAFNIWVISHGKNKYFDDGTR